MTVNAFDNNLAYTRARIGGLFFNDGTGDYTAGFYIGEDLTSGLRAAYFVERCYDVGCNSYDNNQWGLIGPVNIGESHTLRVEYNQALNRFEFQFDGGAVVIVVSLNFL